MFPDNLKYSKEHEWVKADGKIATIGITAFAQEALGDVVFAELPEIGREVKQMDEFGVVESIKTVSNLFSPVSGKVIAINQELAKNPAIVNQAPYDAGWMIKVEMSNQEELNNLLSAADYETLLGQ